MIGQWYADIETEPFGSLRVDLENRGTGCTGHAYLFYPGSNLPGYAFQIRLPKDPPFNTTVNTIILHPTGGVMTLAEAQAATASLVEATGEPPPTHLDVVFSMDGDRLKIDWSTRGNEHGSILLTKSDTNGLSQLKGRADITAWDEFRQWAVSQHPRNYIFRGQRNPHKLVTSFHRSWRKDLANWIADDVTRLFGAIAEKLNYPLQLGNIQHHAAIWSIFQHHGYPTPLLDWSYSPFVAAYFAFAEAINDSAPRIFIFDQARWGERHGSAQFFVDAAPNQLVVLESMPIANPRHIPQQAITTVTNVADVEAFIRHWEAQDGESYLTVCDLPLASKPQIMRELELMGITYGSLFPGLDGICRDMRDRLFAPPN